MHNALEEDAPNGFFFVLGNTEDPDGNTRGFILLSPTSSTCDRGGGTHYNRRECWISYFLLRAIVSVCSCVYKDIKRDYKKNSSTLGDEEREKYEHRGDIWITPRHTNTFTHIQKQGHTLLFA